MKGLILAATLSAAIGFTYSALSAGPFNPPYPDDPNCYKNCGSERSSTRAIEIVTKARWHATSLSVGIQRER